ncbi:MAG: DNA-processing protein DprA [Nitrospiria bacterium]
MSDQELIGWLALKKIPRLGDAALQRLMEVFDSSQAVFSASMNEIMERASFSEQLAGALKKPSAQHQAQAEVKKLRGEGITVITLKDAGYPKSLSAINDPPPILYIRGELLPSDNQAVAIVGSRKASPYGIRTAERIANELSAHGFTIVSGLARGVDSAAHLGALAAEGRTIAVLGCGLDNLYPPENAGLREKIAQHGAVISEFPLGTAPLPAHFPHRNRIISGLSLGTLVVEAAERSGSLITAQCALEQGREVFAIPGNLGATNSQGTNRLIKAGAKLVEEIQDILEELAPQMGGGGRRICGSKRVDLEPIEATLYEMLSDEPRHIDELITESSLPSAQVSGVLLQLELKGTIKHLSGHLYVRN